MRVFVKIGYLIIISIIVWLFFLEYESYIKTKQTINLGNFQDQIGRIKSNIDTIEKYHQTVQNQGLKGMIEFCYRHSKDIQLDKSNVLNMAQIYEISKNSSTGGCNINSYYTNDQIREIYNDISYDSISFFEYTNLGNKTELKEIFQAILNREEQTTSAFIKSMQILLEEEVDDNV